MPKSCNLPPPSSFATSWMPTNYIDGQTSSSSLQSARLVIATVAQPRPVVGFVHLFLSFLAGGILFTALFAGFTTFVAVGQSNLNQLWSIAKSVIHRTWTVFCIGLNEARLAIRMDGKWQWKQAWSILKTKLGETRQAAVEGVDAIKAERNLYATVVGQPGLITFQYFLNRLMPFSLSTQMEGALRNAMGGVRNDLIRRVDLLDFSVGDVYPQLLEARNYDLGKEAVALDVDVKWESHVYAKLNVVTRRLGVRVPVTVRNATFEGTARIELTPLTPTPPGWGAILVSLPSVPKIGLRVETIGGDVTKVPWLKKEILKLLQKAIQDQFLWPKRLVLPSVTVPPNSKTVISYSQLEGLKSSDPLLTKQYLLEEKVALKDHVMKMKPNVTAVPESLDISLEDDEDRNSTDGSGAMDADETVSNGSKHQSVSFWKNPFTNMSTRKTK